MTVSYENRVTWTIARITNVTDIVFCNNEVDIYYINNIDGHVGEKLVKPCTLISYYQSEKIERKC